MLEIKCFVLPHLYVSSVSGFVNGNTPSGETLRYFLLYHGYPVTGFDFFEDIDVKLNDLTRYYWS